MSEQPESIEARIRARIEADLADPEWRARMERSLADARAGRVIPARLALLPLPRWAFWVLFRIAPYLWGRSMRLPVSQPDKPGQRT